MKILVSIFRVGKGSWLELHLSERDLGVGIDLRVDVDLGRRFRRPLILVDANAFGIDRHISRREIGPAAGVVVGNAVALTTLGLVGVTAEDLVSPAQTGMDDRARSHLCGK